MTAHGSKRRQRLGPIAILAITASAALAAPVQIYAAGSLKDAMQALIAASGVPAADIAKPVYGPAGLLRERLAKGEAADIFASADMTQPVRLAEGKAEAMVVPFARNLMCLVSKSSLGLTPANVIDKMLDPSVRLAISTPVADPGGDYALAVFAKADALHPGAGAILRGKALHLLGAPNAMVAVAGHSPAATIFQTDRADSLLYYCSGAPALLKEVDGLEALTLPEPLEVHPVYGLIVLTPKPEAARLALFILSTAGQAILSKHGFRPIATRP